MTGRKTDYISAVDRLITILIIGWFTTPRNEVLMVIVELQISSGVNR